MTIDQIEFAENDDPVSADQLRNTRAWAVARPNMSTSRVIVGAIDELIERRASFDLRWDADMRAIKRWQAAHPGNDLTWPDHADMVVWLLEQIETRA